MRSDNCRLSPEDLAEGKLVQRQALAFRLQCRLDAMAERDMESVTIGRLFVTELVKALTDPTAPCDGSGAAGETGTGSIRQDDSAVDEASSEVEAPDPSEIPTLKAEIERLKAALAESERKRVEAIEMLSEICAASDSQGWLMAHAVPAAASVIRRARPMLSALTTQEGENGR